MPDRFLIRIAHHPDPTRIGRVRYMFTGERLELGRGSTAFGIDGLLDPRMSRAHARIIALSHGLIVEDLGSRNGTLIDGHPVRRAELDPGDIVGMGRVIIQVGAEPSDQLPPQDVPEVLVTCSPSMWELLHALDSPAFAQGTAAVVGADGSGRSIVAHALHQARQRTGAVIRLPLAGVPDDRLQVALHGSAVDPDDAPLARAAGGTLILSGLDAARPAALQAVCDFLDDRIQRPQNGTPRPVDVDVVVTATRDLTRAGRGGDVPRRLLEHIGPRILHLPRLVERREDILPLARHLVERHAGRRIPMDRNLAMQLALHRWPGEVDELDAVISRIVADQGAAAILELPAWGPRTFGPLANEPQTTFDTSDLNTRGGA